jgi:hypothetical protein
MQLENMIKEEHKVFLQIFREGITARVLCSTMTLLGLANPSRAVCNIIWTNTKISIFLVLDII